VTEKKTRLYVTSSLIWSRSVFHYQKPPPVSWKLFSFGDSYKTHRDARTRERCIKMRCIIDQSHTYICIYVCAYTYVCIVFRAYRLIIYFHDERIMFKNIKYGQFCPSIKSFVKLCYSMWGMITYGKLCQVLRNKIYDGLKMSSMVYDVCMIYYVQIRAIIKPVPSNFGKVC